MATIRMAYHWTQKNPNFMTPHTEQIEQATNDVFVELSYGEFLDKPLFGVTVLKYNKERKTFESGHELSTSFNERARAESYFSHILAQLKFKEIEA